jgi:hypothetical protein
MVYGEFPCCLVGGRLDSVGDARLHGAALREGEKGLSELVTIKTLPIEE